MNDFRESSSKQKLLFVLACHQIGSYNRLSDHYEKMARKFRTDQIFTHNKQVLHIYKGTPVYFPTFASQNQLYKYFGTKQKITVSSSLHCLLENTSLVAQADFPQHKCVVDKIDHQGTTCI